MSGTGKWGPAGIESVWPGLGFRPRLGVGLSEGGRLGGLESLPEPAAGLEDFVASEGGLQAPAVVVAVVAAVGDDRQRDLSSEEDEEGGRLFEEDLGLWPAMIGDPASLSLSRVSTSDFVPWLRGGEIHIRDNSSKLQGYPNLFRLPC